ncbi:MAG: bile acid:sodium symporter [Pirellulaceae bacterium]|nr:bile acid:sodium symporter [Pirellulaceae bacterium]
MPFVLQYYPDYEYSLAATQLMLAMLGMGATLTWQDFCGILQRPQGIALVLLNQYILFPLVAIVLWWTLDLPTGIAIGLLLVMVMPSGSASNIFTHLGHGNVPLSMTATAASTVSSLLFTPIILRVFVSNLSDDFRMPIGEIMIQIIVFMILPLSAGMIVGHYAVKSRVWISRWLIRGSLLALACIVIGALGSGRLEIWQYGWWLPLLLLLFGAAKFFFAGKIAKWAGFSARDSFTMAIEVGLRNCNLAVLLLSFLFPADDPQGASLGSAVLYVALFYGGSTLFIAVYPIIRRRLT